MKRLFLASSFADVADIFVQFSQGESQGKTVAFIPTASLHEEINFYVAAAREAFIAMGMEVCELEIATATEAEMSEALERCDYIYVWI